MINYYGYELSWIPKFKKSNLPKYLLIAQNIEQDINDGKLTSGFKLPPQRIIADYLGINHSTVTRAYKLCEEKGLITGVIGKGTYVSTNAGIPIDLITDYKDNHIIELGMGLPLYEVNNLIKSHVNELNKSIDYDMILKYSPPEGLPKHRYIASKWLKKFKIDSTPENIIITSGSQNALSIILISLFDKGDRIIVDELTYTGIKSLAKLLGIILVPVKTSSLGIDIDELNNTCKRENAKGVYLIPDCHNPTSATIDEEKRYSISKIVNKYNLILIEDGTYSFCQEKKIIPISSINHDNCIYIHGTSKALNPTFRISYIVSPKKYIHPLQHGINNITWMSSPLNSEIVSLLQRTSKYDEIINTKLKIIKERNQITDKILNDFDLIPSKTSFFRYLSLPNGFSDTTIERLCLESGVQIFSSKRFSIGMNNNHNAIRIAVSAPKNNNQLFKGLKLLKDTITSYEFRSNPIV